MSVSGISKKIFGSVLSKANKAENMEHEQAHSSATEQVLQAFAGNQSQTSAQAQSAPIPMSSLFGFALASRRAQLEQDEWARPAGKSEHKYRDRKSSSQLLFRRDANGKILRA